MPISNNRFVESELRQAIHVRDNAIAQWRDVGAPDLVHLTKVPQARSNSKEVGVSNCKRRVAHFASVRSGRTITFSVSKFCLQPLVQLISTR